MEQKQSLVIVEKQLVVFAYYVGKFSPGQWDQYEWVAIPVVVAYLV